MKKYLVFLVVALVCFQAYAQRIPKIKGSKNVIEVREDLATFKALELEDDLDIVLQNLRKRDIYLNWMITWWMSLNLK